MLRNQYLSISVVDDFINWLAVNLDHPTLLAHAYIDRRRGKKVFKGLHDACSQYHWKHQGALHTPGGTSLASSHATVSALGDALQSAVKAGNDLDALVASTDVMTWGGVRAGNVRWLTINHSGLAQTLASTSAALASDNLGHPLLTGNKQLRFNAGMTKIYSLLVNDLIIYDSRVAAALGWIVVKYCQARHLSKVPSELAFPWAPAKEAKNAQSPKNRNPGQRPYLFPHLRSGEHHARWNVKASWVLAATLARAPGSVFNTFSIVPALRRLEAALFMIGYDLPLNGQEVDLLPEETPFADDDWTECYTAARGKQFYYQIEHGGIRLRDKRFYPLDVINRMLNILHGQFGGGSFPLANSATCVRSGDSESGIGSAYFQATAQKGNPPATSALAAVLHELGVLTHTPGQRDAWSINSGEFADQQRIDVAFIFEREIEARDVL